MVIHKQIKNIMTNKKFRGRILLTSIAILVGFAEMVTAGPIKFYVSLTGNDSNIGTIDRPFATLEAAQNAVRAAKKSEANITP